MAAGRRCCQQQIQFYQNARAQNMCCGQPPPTCPMNCGGNCGPGPCPPGCTYPCGMRGATDRYGNPCQPDCLYCPDPMPGYMGFVPRVCKHGWTRSAKHSPSGTDEKPLRFGQTLNTSCACSIGGPTSTTRKMSRRCRVEEPPASLQYGGACNECGYQCDPQKGPCMPGCGQGSPCYRGHDEYHCDTAYCDPNLGECYPGCDQNSPCYSGPQNNPQPEPYGYCDPSRGECYPGCDENSPCYSGPRRNPSGNCDPRQGPCLPGCGQNSPCYTRQTGYGNTAYMSNNANVPYYPKQNDNARCGTR